VVKVSPEKTTERQKLLIERREKERERDKGKYRKK
jgi:hypothetical protein